MKKKVLLLGGAGYVGSITCESLISRGYNVIVLDNLYQGFKEAVHPEAELIIGTIEDKKLLDSIFVNNEIYCVMDFAGETLIQFSMSDPYRYFKSNIIDGMNILNAMVKHNIKRFIFSSTSAIYGEAEDIPMDENHKKDPSNSYGESKFIFELILKWYYRIHGIKSISFRYFNAAGASEKYGEAHRPETHLIPILLEVAAGKRKLFHIFGNDYPTKDGTCIRDFTHVIDIANAHILGLEKIDKIKFDAFNLGNGDGYSVMEVLNCTKEVTGINIPFKIIDRRPGDAAIMIASSEKAERILSWESNYPRIDQIIETAWRWYQKFPNGYKK